MIRIDISEAIFLYLLGSVVLLLFIWVFFEQRFKFIYFKEEDIFIVRCDICTHAYVDSLNREVSRCPVCGSYNIRKERLGNVPPAKKVKPARKIASG